MTREELTLIVEGIRPHTLIAQRMYEALGIPIPPAEGHTRDKSAKRRKYAGAKRLTSQRYGVRL